MSVPPTPADLAAKGFVEWALADGRPNAEWVITRAEARALAARADELERYCETQDWHTEWYLPMRQRAERAEKALREIAEARVEYRREGHGFAHHLTDGDGNYLGSAAPALQTIARAALGEQP